MGVEQAAVLALVVMAASSWGFPAATGGGGSESDEIRTRLKMVFRSMESTETAFPNEIHYNVSFNDREVTLKLIRNRRMETSIPIFTAGSSGQIVTVDIQDDPLKGIIFYQDTDAKAAVSMRVKNAGISGSYAMEGLVFYKDSMYYIRPFNTTSNEMLSENGALHILKKISTYNGSTDAFAPAASLHALNGTLDRRIVTMSLDNLRRDRIKRGVTEYTIDMLYVTDYAMYRRMLEFKMQKNPGTTAEEVMREMRYYLAHVSNAVDMRYKSINVPEWTLRTKLVGFYMSSTPAQSSWTEAAKSSGSPSGATGVDISAALKNVQIWLTGTTFPSKLPSFDHAVLFTGYDAYTESKGIRSYDVAGFAYVGTLCGPSSVSVAEYSGALAEASTVAHELGHSLSARHDGDGNSCSAASTNIMAAITTAASSGNEQNFYRFSDCSISYFKNMVATLSKKTPNCLTDSGSYFNTTEWQVSMVRLPGTIYDPNDLCRQAFGPGFEVCGGVKYGERICSALYCHNTTAGASGITCMGASAAGRGVDGTSCGNRKWCQKGICTYDPVAPEGSDSCPLGDFSRTARVYSNQPYSCSNMPSTYCYDQGAYNSCCSTCPKLKDLTRRGCEYGDRTNCAGVSLRSCSLKANQELCCKHCEDKKLPIAGCEWGDSFSNCGQMYPQICSQYPKECCATCAKVNGSTLPIVG